MVLCEVRPRSYLFHIPSHNCILRVLPYVFIEEELEVIDSRIYLGLYNSTSPIKNKNCLLII